VWSSVPLPFIIIVQEVSSHLAMLLSTNQSITPTDILYENPDITKGVDMCRRMSISRIDEIDGMSYEDGDMK